MSLAAVEFLERLRALVPEVESTVREHFGDNDGEVLLHLLTADLRGQRSPGSAPRRSNSFTDSWTSWPPG